jgi:hypothetical protein
MLTMTKEEYTARYGERAYIKKLQRNRVAVAKWEKKNPEYVQRQSQKSSREQRRKDGKYYRKNREYQQTGTPWEKNKIRAKHGALWRRYKYIIAPESVLHHEWIVSTAKYRGVALVEKNQHQHGIINVIKVLDGEIRLLTEKEIRKPGTQN